jgi:hypothetical protein
LLLAREQGFEIKNLETSKTVNESKDGNITAMAVSKDNKLLVLHDKGIKIQLYDLNTVTLLHTLPLSDTLTAI